jgi:hypothetical protein
VHAAYAAPSRLHWYVTVASVFVNENDADVTVVGLAGFAVIVGGATLIVHVTLVEPLAPLALTARTRNVWLAYESPV